ncbi:MAG: hypothetical protein AAGG01_00185 [Planctomycetota bacterium]
MTDCPIGSLFQRWLPLAVVACLTSCNLIQKDIAFEEDFTGKHVFGVSSGWAFVEADVDLSNGTGPLANPVIGGSDVGSSTTDLEPVFGLGLKYFHYITNNWLLGIILEHRIFDPEPTRPLSADVDIDDFGTNHIIIDGRYQFDPIDRAKRLRPFVGIQLGFVPEVNADGEVRYEPISALGLPATTENIELNGDAFFTLGFVAGASYLVRENMTFDFGAFYEFALNPTEDTLVLDPYDGGPLGDASEYDGELLESGLYLTAGLSWFF